MSRRLPLLVGIGFVVVALLVGLIVIRPKMREVGETQDRLEVARQEELRLRTELSRLQQAELDAPETRRELARLRRELPPVADLPGLINLLQDAADQAGVDFFSISPGEPAVVPEGPEAAEIPAQIQVNGGFFAVDEFMFRLETLSRAALVTNISIAEGPDGLPQLTVTLSVLFFTTDVNAGPGAPPVAEEPAPAETPAPEGTPTPEATPAETPGL